MSPVLTSLQSLLPCSYFNYMGRVKDFVSASPAKILYCLCSDWRVADFWINFCDQSKCCVLIVLYLFYLSHWNGRNYKSKHVSSFFLKQSVRGCSLREIWGTKRKVSGFRRAKAERVLCTLSWSFNDYYYFFLIFGCTPWWGNQTHTTWNWEVEL